MKSVRSVFIGQHKAFRKLSTPLRDEDGEVLPGKQSMRARYAKCWDVPSPRWHSAPLRRMVASAVGQNWDEFRSKALQQFGRNDKGRELLRRMDDEVTANTTLVGDEVYVFDRWNGLVPVAQTWVRFYVHPQTRVLMQRPHVAPASRPAAPVTRVVLSEHLQLHFLDGLWFEVELGSIAEKEASAGAYDWLYEPVLKRYLPVDYFYLYRAELRKRYGTPGVYGLTKRQLSHKELVAHDLVERLAA